MDLGRKNQSLCSASILRGEVQELLLGGLRGSFFFLLKSLLNLLQHCFSFMFWIFIYEVLSSPTRDQTHTLLWEGEVLTTVLPGKSQGSCLLTHLILTRSG